MSSTTTASPHTAAASLPLQASTSWGCAGSTAGDSSFIDGVGADAEYLAGHIAHDRRRVEVLAAAG